MGNTRCRVDQTRFTRRLVLISGLIGLALRADGLFAQGGHAPIVVAAAPQSQTAPAADGQQRELSPEEKMNRRFPQPVRVGDLVGLPVLDWRDSTIGYVRQVVRTPTGKIQLIVPYGRWFGWMPFGGIFDWGRRPVAIPIEKVAILGRQIAALDMPREDFDAAPTFEATQATPLDPDHITRIALTRR